jgi:hypothetical protein
VTLARNQLWSQLGEEVVVLDLGSSSYLGLDDVAARVWELMKQPRSVEEIELTLVKEYDVDPEQCSRDVRAFLTGLIERGLVVVDVADT